MATATKIDPNRPAPKNAKPGTADKAAVKEKAEKVDHPLINNSDSSVYPFPAPALTKDSDGNIVGWSSGAPDDFDPKTHKPLKKADFAEEWQYHQYRLDALDDRRAHLIAVRNEAHALGNTADRKSAVRLAGFAKKISEIQEKLAADNVDTASILKNAGVDMTALEKLIASSKDA